MMIKDLKYLNDYYFEPDQGISKKFAKVLEEIQECIDARDNMITGKGTGTEFAQELLDVVLSTLNLLKKLEKEELIDIPTELFKHSVKLNNYLETKKYSI